MGTGSRGGVKLPRKMLHPEGRKYKMQPREFRTEQKRQHKQKFTPGPPQTPQHIGGAQERKATRTGAPPELAPTKSWASKDPTLTLVLSSWWKQAGDHQR